MSNFNEKAAINGVSAKAAEKKIRDHLAKQELFSKKQQTPVQKARTDVQHRGIGVKI